MAVNPDKALGSEYNSESYSFCGAGCRTKFENDPAGVLSAFAAKAEGKRGSGGDGGAYLLLWIVDQFELASRKISLSHLPFSPPLHLSDAP